MLNEKQQKQYNKIIEILKTKKVRITNIRKDVIEILIQSDHPTSASIIKGLEQKDGTVNIMSVYNTLDLLLGEHILSANTFNGKQICYEILDENTAHFTCVKCHRLYHVEMSDELEKELEKDLSTLAKTINFDLDHFKIEGHGICESCRLKDN